jgi:TRAP-type mannitol/chloroaromatic compound transport system substrate-binding protein
MERRQFLTSLLPTVAAGALALPTQGKAQPKITLTLQSGFGANREVLYGASVYFAERLAAASGGEITAEAKPDGGFVPVGKALESLADGTIDMCHAVATAFAGKNSAFNLSTSFPFGLSARQQFAWWMFGGGEALLKDLSVPFGALMLPGGNTGAQMGGWFRREINTPADLNGLKMRVGGLGAPIMQRLGVIPRNVGQPQIAASLQSGEIDAAEIVNPADDEFFGAHKAAKYYYHPGWWESGAQFHFYVSTKRWASLSQPHREMIRSLAIETNAWMQAKYDVVNAAALQRITKDGIVIRPFPEEVMQACHKATLDVLGEMAGSNPLFKALLESQRQFMAHQWPLMALAERSFDDFMVRNHRRGL